MIAGVDLLLVLVIAVVNDVFWGKNIAIIYITKIKIQQTHFFILLRVDVTAVYKHVCVITKSSVKGSSHGKKVTLSRQP